MARCYVVVKYLQPATSTQGRGAVTRPSPCLWKALLAAALDPMDFLLFFYPPEGGSPAGQWVVANPKGKSPPDLCQGFLSFQDGKALEWIKRMHALYNVVDLKEFCSLSAKHLDFLQLVTEAWRTHFHLKIELKTEEELDPHIAAFRSAWRQLRELMVKEVPGFATLYQSFAAQQPSLLKSKQTRRLVTPPLWRPYEVPVNIKQRERPPPVPLPVPVPVPKIAQTPPTPVASAAERAQQSPKTTTHKNRAIVTGIGGGQRPGTSRGGPEAGAKPEPEECPYDGAPKEVKDSLDIDFEFLGIALRAGYAEWQTWGPGDVNKLKAIWLRPKLRNGVFRIMRELISSAERNPTAPQIEAAETSTKSQAPETEAPLKAATPNSAGLEALPCYLAADVKATLKEVIRLGDTKELLKLCKRKPLANDINVFKKLSDQLKPEQFHINSPECLNALRKACEACVWRQPAPESHTADATSKPQSFERMRVDGKVRGVDKSVLVGLKSCTSTECKHLDAKKWMWDFLCQLRSAFPDRKF